MNRDYDDLPRVLSARTAKRLQISRSTIRHARAAHGWQLLTPGIVLTSRGAPTRDDWILAGLELSGPGAAVSGWDALRVVGLGPRTPPVRHVLLLDRSGAVRTVGGVHIRPTRRLYSATLLPSDHPTLPYVPIVEPARAVADTALMCRRFDPVRAMVTSAVQRRVCRPEDLLAELRDAPRQGSHWLRRALEDVVAGARSIAEAQAIEHLIRARVPTFEVNVPIVDRFGTLIAEADILWRSLRMIVEIDSREFHFSENDWLATMRRHTLLSRSGFAIEHHAPSAIRVGGSAWASGVREGVHARALELGVSASPGRGPLPVPPGGHAPLILG